VPPETVHLNNLPAPVVSTKSEAELKVPGEDLTI